MVIFFIIFFLFVGSASVYENSDSDKNRLGTESHWEGGDREQISYN